MVARICLATGARWSEAEGLASRQVRDGRIHYARTNSSKNRSIPICKELQKKIRAAIPFGTVTRSSARRWRVLGWSCRPGR